MRKALVGAIMIDDPVRIGIIGAGVFGTMMIIQLARMQGLKPSIVADVKLDHATQAFRQAQTHQCEITEVQTAAQANTAMDQNKMVITKDAQVLVQSDIDIVVESTGNAEVGAQYAYDALMNNKHIVLVNVETDALVGPILQRLADNANLHYSLAYGDQPALINELCDWATTLGLEIIAAGKGTRYKPAFRRNTPEDALQIYGFDQETIQKMHPNSKMYNSFIDGTKSAVEMVSVSNMTGLKPDIRGMHFPTARIQDIPNKLCLEKDGGILHRERVVEVVSSLTKEGHEVHPNLRHGVYLVFRSINEHIQQLAGMYCDQKGTDNAFLYRPYHFTGIEAPISVAKIAFENTCTGFPRGWYSDVIAVAKRDLAAGEVLDGGGGYTVYGLAEDAYVSTKEHFLPIGLANGVRVKRRILADEIVTYDDVELNEASFGLQLRRMQELTIHPIAS
jgi:predicted homoserine dehydrogenase-like protein